MTDNRYLQQESNVFSQNRLLKTGILAIVIYSGVLTVLFTSNKDQQMTHLVPVSCPGECWVSGSSASDDYLRSMSEYIVFTLGNVTAGNARRQLSSLLPLFTPEKYSEYRERFNAISRIIERYPSISYSIQFHAGAHVKLINSDTLQVQTVKRRIVRDEVPRTENLTYEIKYRIAAGRFWIDSIKELKDHQPGQEGAPNV